MKKLHIKNVGFEPQELTFSHFLVAYFLCSYRKKFSFFMKNFVHEVVAKIWKVIFTTRVPETVIPVVIGQSHKKSNAKPLKAKLDVSTDSD